MNYQFFKQLEMLRILLDYVKKHSSSKQDSQYDAVKYFYKNGILIIHPIILGNVFAILINNI